MSRALSMEDALHLQQSKLTLVPCALIEPENIAPVRYTAHDRAITVARSGNPFGINGAYDAIHNFDGEPVRTADDLTVGNGSISTSLEAAGITSDDIRARLYDNARITIFLVNWANPTNSGIILQRGVVGVGGLDGRGVAKLEIRDLRQLLKQTIIEEFSVGCRADLGDARCQVDLAPLTITGAVGTVTSARLGFNSSDAINSVDWFTGGLLTFTSGANDGNAMEVRSDNGAGSLTLFEPMPHDIQVGDTFTLYPGCDKTHQVLDDSTVVGHCKNKFNNVLNFRGEPFIPGLNQLIRGPE